MSSEDVKLVRIVGCLNPNDYWYSNRIGDVFGVILDDRQKKLSTMQLKRYSEILRVVKNAPNGSADYYLISPDVIFIDEDRNEKLKELGIHE